MSTTSFCLIIASSVMHALWNLLVKRSQHKTVFIWWMFLFSGAMFTAVLPVVPGEIPVPEPQIVVLAVGGAACFFLYHLFNGRAYREGDLSLTYPLSQTSMLYVPLWGVFLLGEKVSAVGATGILLVILGAYTIQLQRMSLREIARPFRSLREQPVQAALAAGFTYSFGAIIDKKGVEGYSPLYFTFLLVFFMFMLMTANLLRGRYRGHVLSEWRQNRILILLSGPVMMSSFLLFRYGLSMAPMSYAVLVRQVSVVVGVAIGVLFLGEKCGAIRMMSAMVMMSGIVLIRIG